ncbi:MULTISPECIES: hypothetical protein [Clostridia]|uniref:Bacterial transcription activator effector binding domain-containing protein n=1 Tax=Lacrimispora celerecrescens TaxID=29354 RepID=A0A084JRQ0_9FIRM|nr:MULTISPECIES: hypothetical protein [Clostridia]KEZ91634.1 hypothetical protein IO98_00150 [Lacrimispora celerecrescens]MSS08987.1 hypothetical protein [Clostridium sp. WB02_MRS01]
MDKNIYSEIKIVTLERFKVARYVVISPAPEMDVIAYLDKWAEKSGLSDIEGYKRKQIGWDFPFVTKEQQEKFGLRGYVAAYVIPENFVPKCEGAEIAYIEKDTYATITITNPHSNSFENITNAYHMLLEYAKTSSWENRLAFEEEYDIDGVHYMDVYVPMN